MRGGIAVVLEEDDVAEAVVFLRSLTRSLKAQRTFFDELVGHSAKGLTVVELR